MEKSALMFYAENGNCSHASFFKNGAWVQSLKEGKSAFFVNKERQTLTTTPIKTLEIFGNGYVTFTTESGSKYQLTM